MGLYYSGGYDWPYNDALLANPADSFLAVPHGEDYLQYATIHVRELIDRYRPSVLWNDICWPAGGNHSGTVRRVLQHRARRCGQRPLDRTATAARCHSRRVARVGGVLLQRFWSLIPEGYKSLTFPANHHYDFRTPEYASFDTVQEKKWESTRGLNIFLSMQNT